jgi:integrase
MNAEFLDCQLAAYLSLRETLGFQITADKRLLTEFVEFVLAQGLTGPIRVQLTLDWACSSSAQHGATGCARRLSVARRFLLFVRASAPQTEIPGPGLLPSPKRPKPYIFTSAQIAQLVATARDSRPRHSLRPHTLSTLIGLLASTGLRAGEAIRLQITDVKLDLDPPQLHVLQTKFRKSRIVPLHPSTADQLRYYAQQRAQGHYDGLSDTFFVSEQGRALDYANVEHWFLRLCRRLGLLPTDGSRGPCLTSFRHTFAVTCLRRWYQQQRDVQTLLPHLSVYLGHIGPQATFWYLTAVPELLDAAAERFHTYASLAGDDDDT